MIAFCGGIRQLEWEFGGVRSPTRQGRQLCLRDLRDLLSSGDALAPVPSLVVGLLIRSPRAL
jgi:hypothetical protein